MFNSMTGNFAFEAPDLDGYDWSALHEIVSRITRYGDDYRTTSQTLRELSGTRHIAERKDTAAFAEAIQSGKKDPGTPNADKLEAEIGDLERRKGALRVALSNLESELLDTIEAGRGEWLPQVKDGLGGAERALEEARQAVAAAEAERARHLELIAWLTDPQDYRPGKASKARAARPTAPSPAFSVINMGGRGGSQ